MKKVLAAKPTTFARLRPIIPNRTRSTVKALTDSFHRLAKAIGPAGEEGLIAVEIAGRGTWFLTLTNDATAVETRPSTPTLSVHLDAEDWLAILRGDASAFDVFLQGRIRVVGRCGVAERMIRKLAASGDTEL